MFQICDKIKKIMHFKNIFLKNSKKQISIKLMAACLAAIYNLKFQILKMLDYSSFNLNLIKENMFQEITL